MTVPINQIICGDNVETLRTLPDACVDSCVTDPPYGLEFMGKAWDKGVPGVELWREVLRVLKPGGHLLAFAGTRTQHRMATAIEDAGFEIRDMIAWVYGSGFPKSLDVSKAIDATDDAKRWQGWGTALKPAVERWVLARKPIAGTVAANVLAHGTGALNIDGCRVACDGGSPSAARREEMNKRGTRARDGVIGSENRTSFERETQPRPGEALGRWPANVVLSHAETCSDECDPVCPVAALDAQSGNRPSGFPTKGTASVTSASYRAAAPAQGRSLVGYGDEGGASRFFPVFHPFGYFGKAKSKSQRGGENRHPTVKNVELMRWLVRLVTPRGGLVLDAFGGSGTTGVAAILEGCRFIAAEADADSVETARARLALAERGEIAPPREPKPKQPRKAAEPQPALFAATEDDPCAA